MWGGAFSAVMSAETRVGPSVPDRFPVRGHGVVRLCEARWCAAFPDPAENYAHIRFGYQVAGAVDHWRVLGGGRGDTTDISCRLNPNRPFRFREACARPTTCSFGN